MAEVVNLDSNINADKIVLQEPTQVGFLQEDNGHSSSMRLMSMVALIAAILFGLVTLLKTGQTSGDGIFITFGFLVSAFAPKAVQKFAEERAQLPKR